MRIFRLKINETEKLMMPIHILVLFSIFVKQKWITI